MTVSVSAPLISDKKNVVIWQEDFEKGWLVRTLDGPALGATYVAFSAAHRTSSGGFLSLSAYCLYTTAVLANALQYLFMIYMWVYVQKTHTKPLEYNFETVMLCAACFVHHHGCLSDIEKGWIILLWPVEQWRCTTDSKISAAAHEGTAKDYIPWWVRLVTLFNQILIPNYIMVVGSAFLATSEGFNDLVMNSTGLWFIMQLDDVLVQQYAQDVIKPCVDVIKDNLSTKMDSLTEDNDQVRTEGSIKIGSMRNSHSEDIEFGTICACQETLRKTFDEAESAVNSHTDHPDGIAAAIKSVLEMNRHLKNLVLHNEKQKDADDGLKNKMDAAEAQFKKEREKLMMKESTVIDENGHVFGSLQLNLKFSVCPIDVRKKDFSSLTRWQVFTTIEFLMPLFAWFWTGCTVCIVTYYFRDPKLLWNQQLNKYVTMNNSTSMW